MQIQINLFQNYIIFELHFWREYVLVWTQVASWIKVYNIKAIESYLFFLPFVAIYEKLSLIWGVCVELGALKIYNNFMGNWHFQWAPLPNNFLIFLVNC